MTSFNESDAIPGNADAVDKLVARLQSGKAIAFVGAGASMELYKGWNDLLKFLGSQAQRRGVATDDDIEF